MYDLQLTPEQIEFREAVRSFSTERLRPAAIRPARLEPFAKPLMSEFVSEASQMGLRTLALPEDAGGAGADLLTECIVFEELGAGDVDVAAALAETSCVARLLFSGGMNEAQSGVWLDRFVADEDFHLAFARPQTGIHEGWGYPDEPEAEAAIASAREDAGAVVLDGSFDFVANAPLAGLIVVQTGGDPYLVGRGTPGLSVGAEVGAIGMQTADGDPAIRWHHGSGAPLGLSGCRVDAGQRLSAGRSNRPPLGTTYERTRAVLMAAINIGVGRAAYDAAVDYAGLRRQGGCNIIEHQSIGTKIANMAIKLELARNLVWKAAFAQDHPGAAFAPGDAELPLPVMARAFAAEAMHEVTLSAAECFGAMGVMRDMPLQKYVNDGLVFLHAQDNDIASRLRITEAVAAARRG